MLYLDVPWVHLFVDYSVKEKFMKFSSTFLSNNSKQNVFLTLMLTALAKVTDIVDAKNFHF